MTRIPQLYNSVRYEQKPRRWMVRYYDMYPLDPQDRLTIKRAVVTAKTSDEAADIMAVCGKEIIDVELYNPAPPVTQNRYAGYLARKVNNQAEIRQIRGGIRTR